MKNNVTNSTPAFTKIMEGFANFDQSLQLLIDNIGYLSVSECETLNKKFDSINQNLAFINNAMNSIYQGRKSQIGKTSKKSNFEGDDVK